MPSPRPARFVPRIVHRWIAVGLMVLLIPISLSGAFLVWHDEIDAMVHPGRYAVTGSSVAVSRPPDLLAGDRAAQMIRWIHEGEAGGPLWRLVVFLCGLMPSVLGVTGIVVWLRGRRQRQRVARGAAVPQAAE